MPLLAVRVADSTGLGQSFVGSALVGATTSLPEVAVTVSAVRMGAPDLAIGGLLGSNLFDLLILAVDDIVYRDGPILERVGRAHLASAVAAILMCAVVALAWRRARWPAAGKRFSLTSLALAGVYAVQLLALYAFRTR
jgi:cation:H+ antiporter